jgi:raffinose/stachyose/melibiose transport system permease protein
MKNVLENKKAVGVFVIPGLVLYSIIVILPIVWSLYYSFYSGSPGLRWKFSGFDNYRMLLKDPGFANAMKVNLKYVSIVMVGQVGLGLLLSLMFMFWLTKFKTVIRTLVFFPVVLPTVAVGQLFRKIYEIQPNYGLINAILAHIGGLARLLPRSGACVSWIFGLRWGFIL